MSEGKTLFAVELTDEQIEHVRCIVESPIFNRNDRRAPVLQQVYDQFPPRPLPAGWYEVTITDEREARFWDGEQWKFGPDFAGRSGSSDMYKDPKPLFYADE